MQSAIEARPLVAHPIRTSVLTFLAVTLLTGGVLSWFASKHPDGLEWSITKVAGQKELKAPAHGVHGTLANFQEKLSFLPDYSFRKQVETPVSLPANQDKKPEEKKSEGSKLGTSVSGIVGGSLTLGLSFLIGYMLKRRNRIV